MIFEATITIEVPDEIKANPEHIEQYLNLYLDRDEHYRPDLSNRLLHALDPEDIITNITAQIPQPKICPCPINNQR